MKHHFEKAGIDVGVIDDGPLETEVPPWKLASLTMNLTLSQFKKDSFSGVAFKQLFLEQCERYQSFVKIFTDGSKKEERAAADATPEAKAKVAKPNSKSMGQKFHCPTNDVIRE